MSNIVSASDEEVVYILDDCTRDDVGQKKILSLQLGFIHEYVIPVNYTSRVEWCKEVDK
jgi:hypothetical protein